MASTRKKLKYGSPKLNRGYKGPFDFFTPHTGDWDLPGQMNALDYRNLYGIQGEHDHPFYGTSDQIRGGLQPLSGGIKYVIDTFKPYKSAKYIKDDLLLPFRGLANIGKAILYSLGASVAFLVGLFFGYRIYSGGYRIHTSNIERPERALNFKENVVNTVSWYLDAIASAVRGAAQLGATVLLPVRMIIRGIRTGLKGGYARIEENTGILRRVENMQVVWDDGKGIRTHNTEQRLENVTSLQVMAKALFIKFSKAWSEVNEGGRGQRTSIDAGVLTEAHKELSSQCANYVNLHTQSAKPPQAEFEQATEKLNFSVSNFLTLFKPPVTHMGNLSLEVDPSTQVKLSESPRSTDVSASDGTPPATPRAAWEHKP